MNLQYVMVIMNFMKRYFTWYIRKYETAIQESHFEK